MDRQTYVNQVADRLKALLSDESRLPCKFNLSSAWTAQSDAPITINLEPEESAEKAFEGMDIFAEIQRRLNQEFSGNPWYFGINVGVPHRYLGQDHMNAVNEKSKEQATDNQVYRRMRRGDEMPE